MRHLRSLRRMSVVAVLLVCGLAAVPAVRERVSSSLGAVFGAETSLAAVQAPETFIQQARRLSARGRRTEAEALAKARPAGDPDRAAVLAGLESSRGNYDEALKLLEAAAATNPTGEAALELGLLLQTPLRTPDRSGRASQPCGRERSDRPATPNRSFVLPARRGRSTGFATRRRSTRSRCGAVIPRLKWPLASCFSRPTICPKR